MILLGIMFLYQLYSTLDTIKFTNQLMVVENFVLLLFFLSMIVLIGIVTKPLRKEGHKLRVIAYIVLTLLIIIHIIGIVFISNGLKPFSNVCSIVCFLSILIVLQFIEKPYIKKMCYFLFGMNVLLFLINIFIP